MLNKTELQNMTVDNDLVRIEFSKYWAKHRVPVDEAYECIILIKKYSKKDAYSRR